MAAGGLRQRSGMCLRSVLGSILPPPPSPPSTPGGRAAAQLSRFRLRQSGPSSRSVRACEPAPSWLGRGGRMADSQAFCVAEERSGHCAVVDGHFLYVWGGYVVRGRGGRAGAARERRLGDDCRHRGTPSGFQEARLRSPLHSPPRLPRPPNRGPRVRASSSLGGAGLERTPGRCAVLYCLYCHGATQNTQVTKQLNISAIFSGISLLIKYFWSLKNRFVFATLHHRVLWLKIRITMAVGM